MADPGSPTVVVHPHTALDPDWDDFVEQAPGGHHVQTSRWAEVKRTVAWNALRIVLERDGDVVGGCQVLTRRIGRLGTIAYAPRGPVFATNAKARDREEMLSALDRIASERHFLHFKVQPPAGAQETVTALEQRGYRPSRLETAPTATVLIDVRRSEDELKAAMRTNTSRNLRRAESQGVVVRDGDEGDLPALIALIRATSRRQGFDPYPDAYYETMWRLFHADDHAHMLIAEHEGTPLSAVLLIAFGDKVIYKIGGWSGEPRSLRPNELLHWRAAEWSRRAGYRWYDLEGIDLPIAKALLAGEEPPATPQAGVSHFKLGFGGEVRIFPSAYNRVPAGPLGSVSHSAAEVLERLAPLAARALGRGT